MRRPRHSFPCCLRRCSARCRPPLPAPACPRRLHRGFTLLELMVVLVMSAVLATLSVPGFQRAIHKARRADALVALMQLQAAQERFRANHRSYGNLLELRQPAVSAAGHYQLAMEQSAETGYVALARATGAQQSDTLCSHLRITVEGANLQLSSGADASTANTPPVNRACWNL